MIPNKVGTQLDGYTLWYDGSISIDPSCLTAYLTTPNVFVTHLTPEVIQYNQFTTDVYQIKEELDLDKIRNDVWTIPDEYQKLDVREYAFARLAVECSKNKWTEEVASIYVDRVEEELERYEQFDYLDVLKLMVYIVDTFKQTNSVWGVGRGSSVSSYLLYLFEVHDIDSVKYDLFISDFLK